MSKGYPTREPPPPDVDLGLPAGVCIICKKRPAGKDLTCATCEAALAGR